MPSLSKLRLSTLPGFDGLQRFVSRIVWGRWILGFLFWELTGLIRWTPWKTLSETAWDVEKKFPGTQDELETFLLALVVHIRYRYTLGSSLAWARRMHPMLDKIVRLA